MNSNYRNLAFWALVILCFLVAASWLQSPAPKSGTAEIPYSQLISDIDSGTVREVKITGDYITGFYKAGNQPFSSYLPKDSDITSRLMAKDVAINVRPEGSNTPWYATVLSNLLPILLLVGVLYYVSRQMQNGAGKAMGFGKSKAKILTEGQERVTFDDVAGIDEAKEDLQEIVEFLREPQKFQRLGGKIPHGVLLVGPPGTGKTLTARAVAGEANVPFMTISGSDFVEMFVGVGASRVRDMFDQAKKNAPCIIFIDEIDAVGRHRGAGLGGGNDEREQTLNQLLVEMDGFERNEGIIIIAATNRPDILDPALLRPGRFDRQIMIPNPDVVGREKILRVHARPVPMAPDVNLKIIAKGTPGFSGADLMNLVNEAALLAARRNKRLVTMQEFEDAKDKVMMGAERRSLAMSPEEKKNTAYHEAGHAIVSMNVPKSDPIHKATIIPRGRALGMVMNLPEGDRHSMTREWCVSRLAVLFGGREAEIRKFGNDKVTNGATGDIQMATQLARSMIMEWGMSDTLGRVRYQSNEQEVFLGHSVTNSVNISEETARLIDAEVRRMIEEGEQTAKRILQEKEADWETLAQGLLEYETLSGEEIKNLLNGKPPSRDSEDSLAQSRPSSVPTTRQQRMPDTKETAEDNTETSQQDNTARSGWEQVDTPVDTPAADDSADKSGN